MKKTALVVGATGIVGSHLVEKLIGKGWVVYGLSRKPSDNLRGLIPVSADLQDKAMLEKALQGITPTHIFITTWVRKDTETENVQVNSTIVRNLLDVLSPKKSVQHVALVTGLKHYLGPFEAYGKDGFLPETPLREDQPRRELENFYYAQEDEVYAAAERDGFSWSIHRPHSVIGKAVGNMMNLGTTLAVYATICKETGRKFQWPGSEALWNGISDVTDARILAEHLIWAAESDAAKNKALNVVNGDIFRWKWLWPRLAQWFGVEPGNWDGTIHPLENQMTNDADIWKEIAQKHGLHEAELDRLASPWHTDLDLGKPIEVMTDMSKSRKLGFNVYQQTEDSFFDLFDKLRDDKLIS